jgi:hypothetical protein
MVEMHFAASDSPAHRVLKFLYFPEKALHSAKKSLAPEAAHP